MTDHHQRSYRAPAGGIVPSPRSGRTSRDLAAGAILRILRRRMAMILGIFIGTTLLSVLVTLLWLSLWPNYMAESFLGVSPPESSFLQGRRTDLPPDVMAGLTSTNVKMIVTEPVLERALRSDDITKTQWYNRNRIEAMDLLKKNISVSVIPKTDIVRIAFPGRDPGEIANIVNAVTQAAVEDSNEFSASVLENQGRALNSMREACQQQLAQLRADIEKERPKDLPLIDAQRSTMNNKLQILLRDQSQLQTQKAQMDSTLEGIEAGDDLDPQRLADIDKDPVLLSLRKDRADQVMQRDELLRKFGPKHRDLSKVVNKIGSLDDQIRDCEADLRRKAHQQMVAQYRSEADRIARKLDKVNAELTATQQVIKELEEHIQRVRSKAEQESVLVDQISRIDNKIMDLRMVFQEGGRLFIRREAKTPREPVSPRWKITLPVGAMLGLLIGLALAFTLELMDRSIKNGSDIYDRFLPPVLGAIPHMEDLKDSQADSRVAFLRNPASLLGESFRHIRTCLLLHERNDFLRTLLVASPLPEDGRTTVAVNLAAAVARGGLKVLLVDANFRQPVLAKLFPQCGELGLSHLLEGRCEWPQAIAELEPNLWAMAAGPLLGNPAELLGRPALQKFLLAVRGEFDLVILDGPPALLFTDSAVLSTAVHGTLLVARAGVATQGILLRTRAMFDRVGGRVVGIAVNDVRVLSGGYLQKSYRLFYRYGRKGAAPKPDAGA